eukprot:768231-Hanusia_phi.AAC.6
MVRYNAREYVTKMTELNEELARAWNKEERVKALKMAIQCSKLLGDTSTPQFYPSLFVLVTEILDTFGRLVFERIKQKVEVAPPPPAACWQLARPPSHPLLYLLLLLSSVLLLLSSSRCSSFSSPSLLPLPFPSSLLLHSPPLPLPTPSLPHGNCKPSSPLLFVL